MNFLISSAYAQAETAAPAASPGGSLLPTIFIVGIFVAVTYFLMIRPQNKRQKAHRKMIDELEKGNEVITQGGMAGRVRGVGESFVTVEIAEGVEIKVQRQSVTSVVPKGTLESL